MTQVPDSTRPAIVSTQGIAAFADAASAYESWFQTPLGSYVDRLERAALERLLEGTPVAQVVEIGAGTGHVALWLEALGHRVTAVEPSAAMRAQGIARGRDIAARWVDARAEQLPFATGSFDGAVMFTALEFVAEPVRAIEQALRVIQPDGWLCVGYLHALSSWAAAYRRYGERGKQPWAGARFFVREDLEQMVGRAADRSESAVRLSPAATAPFAAADAAGERAGNAAAMEVLLWRPIR